jgi:hypothetical protein
MRVLGEAQMVSYYVLGLQLSSVSTYLIVDTMQAINAI